MNFGIGRDAMMGGRGVADGASFGFGGFGLAAFVGIMLLAIIVIVLIAWAVARKPSSTSASSTTAPAVPTAGDPALSIARDRLARGDIEPEQYTAIVNALNGTTSPPTLDG